MNILVTGGAGYIGSVITEELIRFGHSVSVYDNLEKGYAAAVVPQAFLASGDLRDEETLTETLVSQEIEAVIHMAAYSLVGESVSNPAKYYENNVVNGLKLLDCMNRTGVRKIVFSSTAAVYGEPQKQPITEDELTIPTNPYGATKLAFENALKWYEQAYGIRYASLRYFNAAGASEKCGEMHEPETHLIPLVLQAAVGKLPSLKVFGDDYPTPDGTCVRDYIHVLDLARAHIKALDILDERSAIYNLGCGEPGYSVKEVIATAQDIVGVEIPVEIVPRRAGDPAVLIADSGKIRSELGWKPEYQNLDLIIRSAWNWSKNFLNSAGARA